MKVVDLEKRFSGVVPACTRQLGTLATGCDSREGAAERLLQAAVLERWPTQEGASHCISCLPVCSSRWTSPRTDQLVVLTINHPLKTQFPTHHWGRVVLMLVAPDIIYQRQEQSTNHTSDAVPLDSPPSPPLVTTKQRANIEPVAVMGIKFGHRDYCQLSRLRMVVFNVPCSQRLSDHRYHNKLDAVQRSTRGIGSRTGSSLQIVVRVP